MLLLFVINNYKRHIIISDVYFSYFCESSYLAIYFFAKEVFQNSVQTFYFNFLTFKFHYLFQTKYCGRRGGLMGSIYWTQEQKDRV